MAGRIALLEFIRRLFVLQLWWPGTSGIHRKLDRRLPRPVHPGSQFILMSFLTLIDCVRANTYVSGTMLQHVRVCVCVCVSRIG
jgi:hypothetical protein